MQVISYLLGTGAAAGFGLTVDAKQDLKLDSIENDFFDKANVASSLLLIGFLLSAVSSVFSSYNLPKPVTAAPAPPSPASPPATA